MVWHHNNISNPRHLRKSMLLLARLQEQKTNRKGIVLSFKLTNAKESPYFLSIYVLKSSTVLLCEREMERVSWSENVGKRGFHRKFWLFKENQKLKYVDWKPKYFNLEMLLQCLMGIVGWVLIAVFLLHRPCSLVRPMMHLGERGNASWER